MTGYQKNYHSDYDVIVAGGGPSGLAAAVAAARQGKKTLLIEKNGYLGGMGVINGAICGLYTSTKQNSHRQLVKGFAGEFYALMQKRGGVAPPYPFGDTVIIVHDQIVWKECADELITQSGAEVMFHSVVTDVIKEGTILTGVQVYSKSGFQTIFAKRFIDCTGDGDLCVKAGAPFTVGKNGAVQYATATFRLGNVEVDTAAGHSKEQIEEWIREAEKDGLYLPRKHIYILPSPRSGEIVCNMTAVLNRDGTPIDSVNAKQMTDGEFSGRKQIREYQRFLTNYVPGFENSILIEIGNELGIRQSRTIQGVNTLTNEDVFHANKSDRCVAKSAWCIEAHGSDGIFMFYLEDDYYEISYDTMVPIGLDNLMCAGRLISAEHEALASARVVAQCLLTGYAAGAGSAVSIDQSCSSGNVDFETVKNIINYE